jgi:hypothetical protein
MMREVIWPRTSIEHDPPARLSRRARKGVRGLAALVALTGAVLGSGGAFAQAVIQPSQDEVPSNAASYVNPFPEGDTYRIQVYGDSFAEGLLSGLIEAFNGDPRMQVAKKHKPIGALVRTDWEDDVKGEEASRDAPHIGVLMFGLSDRQIIRLGQGTKPLAVGSDEWQAEYGRRVDRWIKALKKRSIAIYIAGHPALRRPEANSTAEAMTEVIRERARLNGVRFIDVTEGFLDDGGNFTQFGPDLAGNRQKLRDGDGVTFTQAGNRKLASLFERDLRRDVAQARTERAIPLAGNEAEQRRINPAKAVAAAPAAGWKGTVSKEARGAQKAQPPPQPVDTTGEQKADNGRVQLRFAGAGGREETVNIDIVRPAIPAAVIALLTRKEVTERASQPGEPVTEDIGGGMVVVNSVSSLGEATQQASRRRLAPTQTPYYSVLVKGERPVPKPGRADDFSWPRSDAVLPPPPPQPVQPPPQGQGQRQPQAQQQPAARSGGQGQQRPPQR